MHITNIIIFILYLSSDFDLLLPSCSLSEEVSLLNTLQQTCAHKGGHWLCHPALLKLVSAVARQPHLNQLKAQSNSPQQQISIKDLDIQLVSLAGQLQ